MESTSVDKQANSNETTQSIPHAICSYTVLLTQIYGLNLQNMQYQECKRVQDCKGMKLTSFVYALLSIKFRTALEYIIPLVMQGQKIYMNHRTVNSFFWITLQSDLVFA